MQKRYQLIARELFPRDGVLPHPDIYAKELGLSSQQLERIYFSSDRPQLKDNLDMALFLSSQFPWSRLIGPGYLLELLAQLDDDKIYIRLASIRETHWPPLQWRSALSSPGLVQKLKEQALERQEPRLGQPAAPAYVPTLPILNGKGWRGTQIITFEEIEAAVNHYGFIEARLERKADTVRIFYRTYAKYVGYHSSLFDPQSKFIFEYTDFKGAKRVFPEAELRLHRKTDTGFPLQLESAAQFAPAATVVKLFRKAEPSHQIQMLFNIFWDQRYEVFEAIKLDLDHLKAAFESRDSPIITIRRGFAPFISQLLGQYDLSEVIALLKTGTEGVSALDMLVEMGDIESLKLLAPGKDQLGSALELATELRYDDMVALLS